MGVSVGRGTSLARSEATINGGTTQVRWMVFVREKTIYKWMMTGGSPMTQETSNLTSWFPTIFLVTQYKNNNGGYGIFNGLVVRI